MSIADDVLKTLKPESLEAIAPRIQDGDLLLCAGHDPFSRLIGWSTKSPWTHVALAYRWDSLGRIMVFESVQQIGVRTVGLEKFISQSSTGKKPYPGQIILARHADYADKGGDHAEVAMKKLGDFAVDRFGDPFSGREILKIAARICFGAANVKVPESLGANDEFICSEYAAGCFEAVGIKIQWDARGFIAPADFAQDPNVRAVAQIQTRYIARRGGTPASSSRCGAMRNPWMRIATDAWLLGFEAAAVIGQRTLKIAAGGAGARAESVRMVSEKAEALAALRIKALTGGLGTTPAAAATQVLAHYRRKVRQNRRRLT